MRWLLAILILTLPSASWAGSFSASDLRLVADLVCHEARGESFEDQLDVSRVVLNRIDGKGRWQPKVVSSVLLAPGQFSGFSGEFRSGECRRQSKAWRTALNAVTIVFLTDLTPNHGATHFALCRLGRPFGPKFTLVKRNASHCYWRKDAS
jgi:hypothetical protein